MKIALLSTLNSGGATIAALRIAHALRRIGHECTFFVLENPAGKAEGVALTPLPEGQLEVQGADFWLHAAFRHWEGLSRPSALHDGAELFTDALTFLYPSLPLPKSLVQADIIHIHWVAGMLFSPALLQALQGKKIVFTLHDMNLFTGGCHYHPTCRQFESSCKECPMLKHAGIEDASAQAFVFKQQIYKYLNPSVVTPSDWLAEEARKSALLGQFPIHTIPNCVDTEVFCPVDRKSLREQRGINNESLVLLVGSDYILNPRKNAQIFVDALTIIAQKHPSAPIEIFTYGTGVLTNLPFPTHNLGKITLTSELVNIYNVADLYVHTARMDNLPNTLCEAQCCGTPILTFDVGGCKETCIPGKTGIVIKKQNALDLAQSIINVLEHLESLIPMREASRLFAVEQFNMIKTAEAYSILFDAISISEHTDFKLNIEQELLQNQFTSLAVQHKEQYLFTNKMIAELVETINDLKQRLISTEQRLISTEQRLMATESIVKKTFSYRMYIFCKLCINRLGSCIGLIRNRS